MDPVLELQSAIIQRLRSFPAVTDLVGQKIADIPKQEWTRPYISIGPSNYITEDVDCIYGGEVMIQIDAWSDAGVMTEVRTIADAVRKAFRSHEFPLTANALVAFDHWRTDYIVDGALKHASVRFTAIVEQP